MDERGYVVLYRPWPLADPSVVERAVVVDVLPRGELLVAKDGCKETGPYTLLSRDKVVKVFAAEGSFVEMVVEMVVPPGELPWWGRFVGYWRRFWENLTA